MKKIFLVTVLCLLLVSVLLIVSCGNDNDTLTTSSTDIESPQGEPHIALHIDYNLEGYTTVTGYYWCKQEKDTHDHVGDPCFDPQTGTLTIPKFGANNTPITAISYNAFHDFQELEHLVLPKGFKEIGYSAFQNCQNLKTVTHSGEIETIDGYAFAGCTSLESLSPLPSITTVGPLAFENCTSLKVLDLGPKLHFVGERAFARCGLTALYLPESYVFFAKEAFEGCQNLETVTLTGWVEELPPSVFANCPSLKTVILPRELRTIGETAFSNSGLNAITLPESITTVEKNAFAGCQKLTNIQYEGSEESWKAISFNAGNTALQNAEIAYHHPYSGTGEGDVMAFTYSYLSSDSCKITGFIWKKTEDATPQEIACFNKETGVLTLPQYAPSGGRVEQIAGSVFANRTDITSVILPDGLVLISYDAFRNCTSLKSVTFTSSLCEINAYAFAGCSSLESVSPFENVIQVFTGAFENCTALKEIDLGEKLRHIGERAFAGSGLISVTIPASVEIIYLEAFSDCKSLKSAELHCSNLKDLYLPARTFYSCTALESVTLPHGLRVIDSYAFAESALKTITLPDSVTRIESKAFQNCQQLQSIMLSEELLTIEDAAFDGCSLLDSVYWREEKASAVGIVSQKKNDALLNAPNQYYGLENMVFVSNGDGTCSLQGTFYSYRLSVTIPSLSPSGEVVTSIQSEAFKDNLNLKTVTIPSSVKTIGNDAFLNCNFLETVIYEGNQEGWEAISIGTGNNTLQNARIEILGQ